MNSHPTADELLAAAIGFIEKIAPQLRDRDVFLARVAVNALATVRRETAAGDGAEVKATEGMRGLLAEEGGFAALNSKLCAAIREGRFDDDDADLLRHLRSVAIDQVGIDQPSYAGLRLARTAEA